LHSTSMWRRASSAISSLTAAASATASPTNLTFRSSTRLQRGVPSFHSGTNSRQLFRFLFIDSLDEGMRVWPSQNFPIEHVGELDVVEKFRPSREDLHHFFFLWRRFFPEKRFRAHKNAWRAEAALKGRVVHEGLRQRIEPSCLWIAQPFDSLNPQPIALNGERHTGKHRLSVEDHGTSPACPVVAGHLRAREPERFPEGVSERIPGFHLTGGPFPISRSQGLPFTFRVIFVCFPAFFTTSCSPLFSSPICLRIAHS